ncbi:hypothetical protein MX572_06720 [Rhodococcus pyridinivorans]|uniref:hypothetical protein n=1 Tax=Rhodococcus pyridinivorans TaxID=103816 RepID=UPI0020C72199|nr:hypothetical protein [Rhodococcus pyridinivorans]UTM38465.1 hypothetical protein MX572_06720 [Rhodococcus pyridinivorans]
MPDLDSVADALYGLDPGDFVAARSEFAAQAREAGDRELTAAIGRLRKPTVAAWMVNLLARERADELAALLDIGSALRTAQRRLSGSEMRKLSEQRRRVVAALERDAGRLAADRGRTVSESALREVGRTLNAALSDPDIGEQVRQGRLDAIVESDGFGDLSAMPLTVVRGGSEEDDEDEDDRTAAGKSARKSKGEREPTEREKAEQAAREAEIDEAAAALDSAHSAAEEAREAASAAEQELARHEEEVAELRAKLEHAEQQRTFARRAAAEAKKRVVAAERAVSAAEVDLARTKN